MPTITVGAPSITGTSGYDDAKAALDGQEGEVKATVTNLMPRAVSLPEIHLTLPAGETSEEITIPEGVDGLLRAVSSLEQIAELNGYEEAAVIEAEVIPPPPKPAAKPAAPAKPPKPPKAPAPPVDPAPIDPILQG